MGHVTKLGQFIPDYEPDPDFDKKTGIINCFVYIKISNFSILINKIFYVYEIKYKIFFEKNHYHEIKILGIFFKRSKRKEEEEEEEATRKAEQILRDIQMITNSTWGEKEEEEDEDDEEEKGVN